MRDRVFVQLSDLHIRAEDPLDPGLDTGEALRRTVRAVYDLGIEPEFFVISGDLSNHGDHAGYLRLRELALDLFHVPVLLALGNHDVRQAFRRVFLDDPATPEAEPYFYAQEFDGLRIAVLDSKAGAAAAGVLGTRQLDWLRQTLRQPAAVGTVVVVHHPAFLNAMRHMDSHALSDGQALADVLCANTVLGLLHGHTHTASAAAWGGTIAVTAPAVAYLLAPSAGRAAGRVEGSGFNLCVVRGGRLTVQPVTLPSRQTPHLGREGRVAGSGILRTSSLDAPISALLP